MRQDQNRSDTPTIQKARKECAIHALAIRSLKTVKRAHTPQWDFVIAPLVPDSAEHVELAE